MSWQDDPIVEGPQVRGNQPAWMNDPVVKQPRADPFAGDDMLSNEAMARVAAGERFPTREEIEAREPSLIDRGMRYVRGVADADEAARRAIASSVNPMPAAEAAGSLLMGAAAMPIASIAGIGTEAARGLRLTDARGEDVAERVQSAITRFGQPRSEAAKATLQAVGALAKPVTDVAEATGADVALAPLAAEAQALAAVSRAPRVPKIAPEKVPSTEELGTAAKQAYARAKEAGAVAAPEGYSRMSSGMRASLREQGFNPKLHPKAAAVVEEIEMTGAGKPVSLDELEILRRQALAAERSIEADERRIAGLIIDRLDDYADALASGAEKTVGGNSAAAVAARKEARDFYARNRKAMEIRELMERAELQASQFSGSGKENALRTQFRQLAMNQKRMRRFTQDEQKAIKDVAFGNLTRNTLRQIGKLAPTGGLSQWLAIGGTLLNPAVASVPIAGTLARAGATRLTSRAAQRAEEIMRRGPRRQAEAPAETGVAREAVDDFDDVRAAAAESARGGYEVEELPASAVQSITLETTPNRLQQLEGSQRAAARTAGATRTQSPPTVKQIESEMRSMERRAAGLPSDSPELLEMDALYQTLKEELALAKKRGKRNRVDQLSGGR